MHWNKKKKCFATVALHPVNFIMQRKDRLQSKRSDIVPSTLNKQHDSKAWGRTYRFKVRAVNCSSTTLPEILVLRWEPRRRNLTSVSNVCEAGSITLFWALHGLKFPFNLTGFSLLHEKLSFVCGPGYAANTCCRKSFSHSTPSLIYNDECLPCL